MYTTVDIPLKLIPEVIRAIKSSGLEEKKNRMRFSIVNEEWNFDGLICCYSDLMTKIKDISEEEEQQQQETPKPTKEELAGQKQIEEIKNEIDKLKGVSL